MEFTLLVCVVAVALNYLFSRSVIFGGLILAYPQGLYDWILCPACSGFWFTAAVGAVLGALYQQGPFGTPWDWHAWVDPVIFGLLGVFTTPLGIWALLCALQRVRAIDETLAAQASDET